MIVVAGTSVILNLCCVGQQDLLQILFGDVFIPPEVRQEFDRAVRRYSRFAGLAFPHWLKEKDVHSIPENLGRIPGLDLGETTALALALEIGADAVLIDEVAGRHAAAVLGITPIGILGILVRARRLGKIATITPVIDQLESRANFWVAPQLRREALRLAGEDN